MGNVIIRAATSGDIPGICHVNRGEDGPWAEIDSCAAYVMNRLRCGFYVQVAEYGGRIAAHGEWIVSDEYRGRTFYLGQLQVDPDLQRRGIGHLMIEDGVAHARAAGCGTVTLIPEQDTHSQLFYEKCGFVRGEDLLFSSLPAREGALRGERLSEAPHELVRTMPFVFGLCQTAAQHMWQVFNRRPDGEGRQVDTLMGDGFCIQLGGFDKQKNALLLTWAEDGKAGEAVIQARAFTYALGYPGLSFCFFPANRRFFPEDAVEVDNYEMILRL